MLGYPWVAARQGMAESEQTLQLPGPAVTTPHRGSHHTAWWVGECPQCPPRERASGLQSPQVFEPVCLYVCVSSRGVAPDCLGF